MAGDFSPKARAEILGRAHGLCQVDLCGPAVDVHHRRPRAAGGSRRDDTGSAANGLALARRCHLRIEAHRDAALALGLLLPQHADPANEPAWLRLPYGTRWYGLGEEGLTFVHGRDDPDPAVLASL